MVKILVIELTFPFETNIEESNGKKLDSYNDLYDGLGDNGYEANDFAIQVRGHRIH